MTATFQNAAMVLSIGIFFSLIIAGLSTELPAAMSTGLAAHGVPAADANEVAHLPAVAVLFAAFLGYNPVQQLLRSRSALLATTRHVANLRLGNDGTQRELCGTCGLRTGRTCSSAIRTARPAGGSVLAEARRIPH